MAKSVRFKTLTPPTPVLPPEYVAKGYKLGGEILPKLAEEMLYCCARYYEHEIYWEKLLKNGNFIQCLKPELTENQKKLKFPEDYVSLFKMMQADQEKEKEEKAEYRKTHRAEIKKETDERKEKYGNAIVDGTKVPVAFMVEAPSIIITRGEDPRFGCWKYRVKEEDITLNCVGGKVPVGFKGKVESSPTSQWVMKYKQNCGRPEMKTFMELPKKINLGGEIATKNAEKKFDKTLSVIEDYKNIDAHIMAGIKSKDPKIKQAALCAWLIAETGIRIGNERDPEKQALTYGASTLLKNHFTFIE